MLKLERGDRAPAQPHRACGGGVVFFRVRPIALDQRLQRRRIRRQAEAAERLVEDPSPHAGLEERPGRGAEARHAERATDLLVHGREAAPDVVAFREERVVEVDDDHLHGRHDSSSRETKIASS